MTAFQVPLMVAELPLMAAELERALKRARSEVKMELKWLKAALAECQYPEDLRALQHFVFHQRLNHMSNTCMVCHRAAGVEDPYWAEEGHAADCAWKAAVERLAGASTLQSWVDRK